MTRQSFIKEKISFLKKWILGSSPRMTAKGLVTTPRMTAKGQMPVVAKARLFSYLTIAFLAGFALFSTNAWAQIIATGTQGTCVENGCPDGQSCWVCVSGAEIIKDNPAFAHYQCAAQPPTYGDMICTLSATTFLKKFDPNVSSQDIARADAGQLGSDIYVQGEEYERSDYYHEPNVNITANTEIAEFIKNNLAQSKNQGKITGLKDTLKKRYDELFQKTDDVKERFNALLGQIEEGYTCNRDLVSELKTTSARLILGKGYSWVAHTEEVLSTCSQDIPDTLRGDILNLAADLERSVGDYKAIESMQHSNATIYEYCVKKDKDSENCSKTIEFIVNDDFSSITSISGVTRGCEPLPFKLYEARSCLFCPLFKTIFNTIQVASTASFAKLGTPMAKLILIGLAIWIALMVLQNVSAMTRQDPFEFITKLLRASFKVIIAYFLLKDPVIIYHYIIGPLLKTGFEFGGAFLNRTQDLIGNCSKATAFTSTTGGVFPAYLQKYLLCFIEAVQFEIATSQAIGSSLMCVSRNAALSNLGPIARVMPDFSMMLQGALIYIISLILSLAYAFYLVDATIQLGIFGMVLPFIILCMPFKVTNSYFKTGVGVFMNSWFVYVFMGIVVNIIMQLIGQSLTGGKGGLTAVEDAINGNEVRVLQDLLGIGFAGFLVLLACCIFGVKLMMKVTDLADQFSGGGLNLGIGSKVGALGAQAATGAAKGAVNIGKSAVKGATNLKVWKGKDGKYSSLNDGLSAAGNGIARGTTSAIRGVTHAVFHPQKSLRAVGNFLGKMRGKERRGASE